ncbi:MAG: gamma-glutamylcyclotransferase [Rhodospirillaceae bacterium]|nr:gamma-glutamylcyclotransferase [Rhodospirillaceae bacterium]
MGYQRAMLYFAYGANLNKRAMRQRCPAARPVGAAELRGYKLCFRRWADIVPAADAHVLGALWQVTPACIRALDAFEGEDYRQITVTVAHDGKAVDAMAYIMTGEQRLAPPDMAYTREIAVGYRDWGFDETILRRARYDTLNVGPGIAGLAAAPQHPAPEGDHPPRRRALWDPAAQQSGNVDQLIARGRPKPPRT